MEMMKLGKTQCFVCKEKTHIKHCTVKVCKHCYTVDDLVKQLKTKEQ